MQSEATPEAHSVAELTRRMAQGDHEAFSVFHSFYANRLFRYLMVLQRGDSHTASDILQDTLIRIVRHVRKFDDDEIFWNWLTKIARSAAADHGRKKGRYLKFLDRFTRLSAPSPDPPETNQILGAMRTSLQQLSPAERAILEAKYDKGWSIQEIANHHQISEDAAESRLARARQSLRVRVFKMLSNLSSD